MHTQKTRPALIVVQSARIAMCRTHDEFNAILFLRRPSKRSINFQKFRQ